MTDKKEKLERVLNSLVEDLIPEKGVPVDTLHSTDYSEYANKRLNHYYYFGKDFTADLEHDWFNRDKKKLKVYTKNGDTPSIFREANSGAWKLLKRVDEGTNSILPLRSGDINQGLFEKIAREIKNKKLPIDGKGRLMKDIIGECDGHDLAYTLNTLELIQKYDKLSDEWSEYKGDCYRSSNVSWIYHYTHKKSKVDIGYEMREREMTKEEKSAGLDKVTTPVYFKRGHPTSDREIIETFKLYKPVELECSYRKEVPYRDYDPERFES